MFKGIFKSKQEDPKSTAASSPAKEQQAEWSCSSCTYINTPARSTCEMCDTSKPRTKAAVSTSPSIPTPTPTTSKPNQVAASSPEIVFAKYIEGSESTTALFDDNLQKFFEDVGVNMEGYMPLAVSWKLGAKRLGEITKEEFVTGWSNFRCKDVSSMKKQVETIKRALEESARPQRDHTEYTAFYKYVFQLAKEDGEGKKLDTELAVEMWGLVLPPVFPLLPKWLSFLEKKAVTSISRDLWKMLLEFAFQIQGGLDSFQDDGSWPNLIDDFVVFAKSA